MAAQKIWQRARRLDRLQVSRATRWLRSGIRIIRCSSRAGQSCQLSGQRCRRIKHYVGPIHEVQKMSIPTESLYANITLTDVQLASAYYPILIDLAKHK